MHWLHVLLCRFDQGGWIFYAGDDLSSIVSSDELIWGDNPKYTDCIKLAFCGIICASISAGIFLYVKSGFNYEIN